MSRQAQVNATVARLLFDGVLPKEIATSGYGADPVIAAGREGKIEVSLKNQFPAESVALFNNDLEFLNLSDTVNNVFHQALLQRLLAQDAISAHATQLGWVGTATSDLEFRSTGLFRQHYEWATIYWTSSFGAKEVHGAIRDRYFQMGADRSYLGYPQTDELAMVGNGEEIRYSNFLGGTILWTASRGAFLYPSFSPITERHQLGAWLGMAGTGFTPNNTVRYQIVNDDGAPQSIGSETAAADGRVGANEGSRYWVDLRFLPGDHALSIARAVDEATEQWSDYQLSFSLH